MKRKKIGYSGVEVSEIILGCWVMGGAQWGGADDGESIRAIHQARELGIWTLDTAEAYNDGYSEEIIGRAIRERPHDYVISSKALNSHLRHDALKKACEGSLRRLGRDYLDLYFLHWPSYCFGGETTPLEETMTAMAELQREGKIRAIGLSNFSQNEFEEAMRYARVDAYQPPFNLLWRRMEDEALGYCISHEIAVTPYSPIAQGLLTGKFTARTVFREGDARPGTPLFQPENRERALELVEQIRPIAARYDRTPAQIAIRWVMQFGGVTAPIVGGRTDRQVRENAKAADFTLAAADFALLDDLSRAFWSATPRYKSFFDPAVVA